MKNYYGRSLKRSRYADYGFADSILLTSLLLISIRLVVEIDRESHKQQEEYDDGRSAEMEKYYIKTIRFSNYEVENNIEKVIMEIKATVNERLRSPPWGI